MQTVFGPGVLYATRTDVTPSTPVNIGYANSFSLSFKADLKNLYGQNQFPLDVARGTVKPTCKATAAIVSGIALNSIFFGETFQSGGIQWNLGEAHSVPASSTYTVTATNGATFDDDLGVVYAASGLPLQKVASVAAVGQYSVNSATGVYTFYSGDASAAILLTYTSTVSTGQTLTINNHLLGYNPTFQLDYYTSRSFQGTAKPFIVRLYNCACGGFDMPFKLEDFAMPEFDMSIMANAAGTVGKIFFPEIN